MGLILYSYRRCPYAIRVRMVLEEKGIPFKVVEEDLSHLSEELLQLHPEGRVPLLVHEFSESRAVIYQSSVITEYLVETFPGLPSLMPSGAWERAQVRLWTYWCDALFKPDLDLFKYEFSSLSPEKASELVVRLQGYLSHWDSSLAGGPFLLGAEMTLADIHLFPFARQFMAIKPAFPDVAVKYPRLGDWLSRMVARPAFARVMGRG